MSYLGSKAASGLYQAIINIMPPHEVYIEPYLGSGQILKRKPPALKSIGIDIDRSTIDSFNYVDHIDRDNYPRCRPPKIITGDAYQFLEQYDYQGDELVYCDPTYPHITRSKKRYRHELSDEDHEELLTLIKLLPCHVIISTYPNEMYDQALLGEWNKFEIQAMTRGGVRTEQVWYNYDLSKVHYHTYAGKNFTDRQRIQRKAKRWARNFRNLPPGERQAVLAAILTTESTP